MSLSCLYSKNPVSRCEATMHLSSEDLSRNEHFSGENRQ